MRKYPRIEIDQKAFDGLQIEAVLQSKTVREIATNAILGNISKEAIMVLDHKTYEGAEAAESLKPPSPPKPKAGPTTVTGGRPKQLARDEAGIARIKELYANSDMSVAEIARQINRPRQTVEVRIQAMISKGELAERPKTTS